MCFTSHKLLLHINSVAYCYHFVNVISLGHAQKDLIKRRPPYLRLNLWNAELIHACLLKLSYFPFELKLIFPLLKYDIRGLLKTCEKELINSLNKYNACELFTFAGRHRATQLRRKTKEIIVENLNAAKVDIIYNSLIMLSFG